MRGSLRVLLAPLPPPTGGIATPIKGAQISLSRGGSGQTLATKTAKSARLVFHTALLKQVRPPSEREEEQRATLDGQIVLEGPEQRPVFRAGANAKLVQASPSAAGGEGEDGSESAEEEPPLDLRLKFDEQNFDLRSDLILSVPTKLEQGFRHLELLVDLEIDGTIEAARTVNDVLDKPLYPKAILVLTDGKENTPRYISEVAGEVDAQTYAIGLGTPENTSAPHLQALAGNHGGYLLITGAIDAATNPENHFLLEKYFLQVLVGINKAESHST
jgi:hypothetical protein